MILSVIFITEAHCFCNEATYKKLQTDQNEVSHSIGFCNILGSVKQTSLVRLSHMTVRGMPGFAIFYAIWEINGYMLSYVFMSASERIVQIC